MHTYMHESMHMYMHASIHDWSTFSISCWIPASRLRRSASVWNVRRPSAVVVGLVDVGWSARLEQMYVNTHGEAPQSRSHPMSHIHGEKYYLWGLEKNARVVGFRKETISVVGFRKKLAWKIIRYGVCFFHFKEVMMHFFAISMAWKCALLENSVDAPKNSNCRITYGA